MTVDAEKITIASVAAVTYKGAQGQLVSVLLSDRPADPKAFAEDTRAGAGDGVPGVFSGAWKSQHFGKRFSGLTFTFSEKGQIVDEELLVGGRNKTFSIGGDEYVLDLTSRAPQIAGRHPHQDPGRRRGPQSWRRCAIRSAGGAGEVIRRERALSRRQRAGYSERSRCTSASDRADTVRISVRVWSCRR